MKGFYIRLLALVLFIGFGFAITMGVSIPAIAIEVVRNGRPAVSGDFSNLTLCIVQWAQTIFVMFLPGIVWAKLVLKENPFKAFHFDHLPWKAVALAIVFTLVMYPTEEWFMMLVNSIPWPESIQTIIDDSALMQATALLKLLGTNTWVNNLNIFLLACLCTGIAEETMFRGALHKLFSQKCSVHTSAILVGLVFAIIHFEYTGFLFRWFLGTAYVYMVYYSGSIWPSICAHATNNLIAFIGMRVMTLPENFAMMSREEQLLELNAQNEPITTPVIAVISLVVTFVVARYFIQNAPDFRKKQEEIVDN